jgi:hypothetical protein
MTNHVHLLVTPEREDSLPRTMQSLGRRYVRTSTRRIAEPERSGRGAAGPRRSTARLISLRAVAMSNGTRCVPAWSDMRVMIAGRAFARTPMDGLTPWSAITGFTARSAAVRRQVKAQPARCFAGRARKRHRQRATRRDQR